jgi:methylase of polypeptide subunit release factors
MPDFSCGHKAKPCEKVPLMEVISTASRPFEPVAKLSRQSLDDRDKALLTLGLELKRSGYRFTAVTPATHRRVNVREPTLPTGFSTSPEQIFGWSRSFYRGDLPEDYIKLLALAGEIERSGSELRSRVRFSTLGEQIFVHSAYPTDTADAVFFGPDTYRFARLVRQSLPPIKSPLRMLDLGAGSGAGGLHAAALLPYAFSSIVLSDINPQALRFCRINMLLNEIDNVETVESDLFENIDQSFDVIITNPPYLVDPRKRLYRHGGGMLGSDLTVQIVRDSLDHLTPTGRLIVYSGSAIVHGVDQLQRSLGVILNKPNLHFHYEEIDPDVFGEELEHPPYDRADRIAVIGLVVDHVH